MTFVGCVNICDLWIRMRKESISCTVHNEQLNRNFMFTFNRLWSGGPIYCWNSSMFCQQIYLSFPLVCSSLSSVQTLSHCDWCVAWIIDACRTINFLQPKKTRTKLSPTSFLNDLHTPTIYVCVRLVVLKNDQLIKQSYMPTFQYFIAQTTMYVYVYANVCQPNPRQLLVVVGVCMFEFTHFSFELIVYCNDCT